MEFVADGQALDIGDGQRETGPLQQRAGIAHVGEGRDARAGAAIELDLSGKQALAQLGERAAAGKSAEEQAVGLQRAADLDQRARNVIRFMQRQQRDGEVDALRLERDVVEAADKARLAGQKRRVRLDADRRFRPCRLARTASRAADVRQNSAAACSKRRSTVARRSPRSSTARSSRNDAPGAAAASARRLCWRMSRSSKMGCTSAFRECDRSQRMSPARYGRMMGYHVADRGKEFKAFAGRVAGWTAGVLFPPACAGCRRQVAEPGTLCGECWPKLRFLEKPWCPVMGTPFSHDMGEGFLSAEAIANPPPFQRARAAVVYSGVARQMAQTLKYNDGTGLAPWMARWMMRAGAELIPDADVIVPVPLHWRRFLWRRFNQSAELARAVASASGKPFEPLAVTRVKGTRQQVGLGIGAREDNVRGAFRVLPEQDILVRGRRVLVIDDVYTTGATASAVARALKRSGAAGVDVLTFARVLPGDFSTDEAQLI